MINLITYFRSGDTTLIIYALITMLLRIPAILLALSIHEASHAFVAYKLGDPTARNLGRMTINPIKHLDPIGAISMLIFGVGWAKPVPINSRNFKKPKWGMALSAAAGPLSNLLQGILGVIHLFIVFRLYVGRLEPVAALSFSSDPDNFYGTASLILYGENVGIKLLGILLYFLVIYTTLNFALAIFNMLPIPPFDGSRLAFVFLPDKVYFGIMKYERFIMIGLMVLFMLGFGTGIFSFLIDTVLSLFYMGFSFILMI